MISVVMPAYNREKTIKRAIDSVLNQTYQDLECIVVDDCSTDKTGEIVKSYHDKRVKYVKLAHNQGACVARNTGIKEAKGEYIAFQDSDDYFEPTKLERQLRNLEKNQTELDFCQAVVCDEEGKQINTRPNEKEIKKINQKGVMAVLCDGNFISTQMILGKTECFRDEECQFDQELPRLQDFDLCLRLSKKYQWSFTSEKLVKLFVQADSISKDDKKMLRAVEIILQKDYQLNQDDKKRLHAHMNEDLGNVYRNRGDYAQAKDYYQKSLQNRWAAKVMIKKILAMIGKG